MVHTKPFVWQKLNGVPESQPGLSYLCRAGHSSTLVGDLLYFTAGFRHSDARELHYQDSFTYNFQTNTWDVTGRQPVPTKGTKHHTADLVGNKIWFVGGGSAEGIEKHVFTFNIDTQQWQLCNIQCDKDNKLLCRLGHASVRHPLVPHYILLYGGVNHQGKPLNDLVVLDTKEEKAWVLETANPPKQPRLYATLSAVGGQVVLMGGRMDDTHMISGEEVCVYNPQENAWTRVPDPQSLVQRSSHRAVTVGNTIYAFGGAMKDGSRPLDLICLKLNPPKLERLSGHGASPSGRTAHTMVFHGKSIYVMAGYSKSHTYPSDAWRLDVAEALPAPARQATGAHLPAKRSAAHGPLKQTDTSPARKATASRVAATHGKGERTARPGKRAAVKKQPAVQEMDENSNGWQQRKRERDARYMLPVSPARASQRVPDSPDSEGPVIQPAKRGKLQLEARQEKEAAEQKTELHLKIKELNCQLKQAESGTVELRNALQNARDQLEAEKDASRVKERETAQLRATAAADTLALQEQLRQAAAARDDAKSQLLDTQRQQAISDEHCKALNCAHAEAKAKVVDLQSSLEHTGRELESTKRAKEGAELASEEHARRQAAEIAQQQQQTCEVQAELRQALNKLKDTDLKLSHERMRCDHAEGTLRKAQLEVQQVIAKSAADLEAAQASLVAEQQKRTIAQETANQLRDKVQQLQGDLKMAEKRAEELKTDKIGLKEDLQREKERFEYLHDESRYIQRLLKDRRRDDEEFWKKVEMRSCRSNL